MKPFDLVISTPDGDLFRDKAVKISLRGTEGDFAIMAGHVPFVTSIVNCPVTIELEDGSKKTATSDGGLLTVGKDEVTLISGSFEFNE